MKKFNDQGNWAVVGGTVGSGVLGGSTAYVSPRTPKTKVYRSAIFRGGTMTMHGDQLSAFNQVVSGTIKIME